jgi:ATP-dependent DNA helicase RecQ
MKIKIKTVLKTHFEFSDFREGQESVILNLLEGRSSLAVFPTGGGKSLCFQLPALIFDGLTLVISPLIALMKDQVEALRAKGIKASRLDSTLTAFETKQVYEDMLSGRLKLLYIAPERLTNESFLSRLKRTKVSLLVIDEAHCISGWGHNFRPEYLRLADVAKKLNLHPVLTLTATATPDVVKDIQQAFSINPADCVQTSFHRKNLSVFITPVRDSDKLDLLTKKLQKFRRFPAIVYVTFQKTAEYVASHLSQSGLKASAYHAGLRDDIRAQVQDDFMSDKIEVIVATIAFGMGIDKGDIRAVYHFNLPKTLSLKALLSVATENRLQLLQLLHNNKPESLYELSKLFDSDISYISREVKVLEGLGLVKLVTEIANGRERLKPVALYDRIILDFDLAQDKVS